MYFLIFANLCDIQSRMHTVRSSSRPGGSPPGPPPGPGTPRTRHPLGPGTHLPGTRHLLLGQGAPLAAGIPLGVGTPGTRHPLRPGIPSLGSGTLLGAGTPGTRYPPGPGTSPGAGTPPVNRMTDRCKNMTEPQTSFAGGKNRVRKAGPGCNLNVIYSSFDIKLTDGQFNAGINGSSDWIHITMNYIGPEYGQGIVIYQDGRKVAADT